MPKNQHFLKKGESFRQLKQARKKQKYNLKQVQSLQKLAAAATPAVGDDKLFWQVMHYCSDAITHEVTSPVSFPIVFHSQQLWPLFLLLLMNVPQTMAAPLANPADQLSSVEKEDITTAPSSIVNSNFKLNIFLVAASLYLLIYIYEFFERRKNYLNKIEEINNLNNLNILVKFLPNIRFVKAVNDYRLDLSNFYKKSLKLEIIDSVTKQPVLVTGAEFEEGLLASLAALGVQATNDNHIIIISMLQDMAIKEIYREKEKLIKQLISINSNKNKNFRRSLTKGYGKKLGTNKQEKNKNKYQLQPSLVAENRIKNIEQQLADMKSELEIAGEWVVALITALDKAAKSATDPLGGDVENNKLILKFVKELTGFVTRNNTKYKEDLKIIRNNCEENSNKWAVLKEQLTPTGQDFSAEDISQLQQFEQALTKENIILKLKNFKNEVEATQKMLKKKQANLAKAVAKKKAGVVINIDAQNVAPDAPQQQQLGAELVVVPVLLVDAAPGPPPEPQPPEIAPVIKKPTIEVIINDPHFKSRMPTNVADPNEDAAGSSQNKESSSLLKSGFWLQPTNGYKTSVDSKLSAEELRDKAFLYANQITDYLKRINNFNLDNTIDQVIFRNMLSYAIARLFLCLWQISKKIQVPLFDVKDFAEWRHFFAHLADTAEINCLTDLAIKLNVDELINNNNNHPPVFLGHFQKCQLQKAALYKEFSKEWEIFSNRNNNNRQEAVRFFAVNTCITRIRETAQQVVAIRGKFPENQLIIKQFFAAIKSRSSIIKEDALLATKVNDCSIAIKMLLAKIGEDLVLLRKYYPEIWQRLSSFSDPSMDLSRICHKLIQGRNNVFHDPVKDISNNFLISASLYMPNFIRCLETIQNEIAQSSDFSSGVAAGCGT